MISQIRKQTITYVMSAFGIVAGLAWNDAIKALIEHFYPFGSANGLAAKFVYAVIVTIIVVLVTLQLIRWAGEEQK
jgi:hypothetical protein